MVIITPLKWFRRSSNPSNTGRDLGRYRIEMAQGVDCRQTKLNAIQGSAIDAFVSFKIKFLTAMYVKQLHLVARLSGALMLLYLCAADPRVLAQTVSPISLVSINSAGTASGNDASSGGVISADGRYVLFASLATDLVSNSTALPSLFVRDLQTGVTVPLEVNRNGTAGANGVSGSAYLSTSGRYVAFESFATDLVSTPDNNGKSDIFLRDLQTGATTLVSVNRLGT